MTMDDIRWKVFAKRKQRLLIDGIKRGKVKVYSDEEISNLRKYYYGGMPLSILILHNHLTAGQCYDRGTMIPYAFLDSEFRIVEGDIDSIKLYPEYIRMNEKYHDEHYADHCFAEKTDPDGTIWVYDTTLGMVIEKELYYKIEHPNVRLTRSKEETLAFMEDQVKDHLTDDKYVLPLVLPTLENNLEAVQPWYEDTLKGEFELLKKTVDYESICQEMPSFHP